MVDPNLRLRPEVPVDRANDTEVVPDHHWHVVSGEVAERVSTVVAKVIDDNIESLEQQGPERKVRINGEAIAMAQDQPLSVRVPEAAHENDPVIREANRGYIERLWEHPVFQSELGSVVDPGGAYWQAARDRVQPEVDWQFTTDAARVRPNRL